MNQLYFNFGKRLDTRHGFDLGGRVDFMFGTDAVFLQSSGLEKDAGHGIWRSGDYYTAIPQMYFEVGYKNFEIKLGKFLSTMGSESILSPDRFFYSLSDSFEEQPYTFTGVFGKWNISKRLSVGSGWVNGENQTFDSHRESALLSDIYYQMNPRFRIGYSALVRMNTKNRDDRDYFVQTFVVGYNYKKFDYTFEWSVRNQKSGVGGRLEAYGINQELVYRINSKWSVGARAEWLHRYTKSGLGHERYKFTLGANWKPVPWLTVRPEFRYERSDGTRPFNKPVGGGLGDKGRFGGAISTYIKF